MRSIEDEGEKSEDANGYRMEADRETATLEALGQGYASPHSEQLYDDHRKQQSLIGPAVRCAPQQHGFYYLILSSGPPRKEKKKRKKMGANAGISRQVYTT